eukprot:g3414.t1
MGSIMHVSSQVSERRVQHQYPRIEDGNTERPLWDGSYKVSSASVGHFCQVKKIGASRGLAAGRSARNPHDRVHPASG